jgi:hypothetical protein
MSGFSEYASALEEQTQLPRRSPASAHLLVDDNSIEQTPPSNFSDKRMIECANRCAEMLPEDRSPRAKLLVDQHLECRHRNSASKGISMVEEVKR